MKREDLEKQGLSKEQIDFIMAENGKDVEAQKAKTTTAEAEREGLKTQLTEASTTIEGFKKLDVEGVKKSADEWKTKAEQAEAARVAEVNQLRFDHALDQALTGAKVKDIVSVKAHLKPDLLKLAEDGSISGLNEQLEKIKGEKDYLFEGVKDPKITTKTNSQTVLNDPVMAAMMKGAGLKPEEK